MKRQNSNASQQRSNKNSCANLAMGVDDPYDVLGVSKTATVAEIKSAYRKLALKHHPDKILGDANIKAKASQVFARIGAAYEILSDEQKRQEYDDLIRGRRGTPHYPTAGFDDHPNHPLYEDPFFASHFGRAARGGFTDSFDLFRQVFGEEFGGAPRASHQSSGQFPQRPRDPFFEDPFFSPLGSFGGGGQSAFGSFGGGGFVGGGRSSVFDLMSGIQNGNGGSASSFSTFSSSSSSFGTGGRRESVSTTTRIVNGRKVTRTERTIVNPDGTVERHVENDGDEDLLPLPAQQRPQIAPSSNSGAEGANGENKNIHNNGGLKGYFWRK